MALRLDKVKWHDIADQVEKISPDLAKLIAENKEAQQLDLYIAEYAFGDLIIKEGIMYLPDDSGKLVPLTPEAVSKVVYEALGYNFGTNPITMVLHNNAEL